MRLPRLASPGLAPTAGRLDLLRSHRAASRETAHLACDDRKTAPLVTGPRGFHRGVERQQVSLEGDLLDHADDVADFLRRLVDFPHRPDGGSKHSNTRIRLATRGHRELVRLIGIRRILAHGRGHLVHRGRGFLQAGGLLLTACHKLTPHAVSNRSKRSRIALSSSLPLDLLVFAVLVGPKRHQCFSPPRGGTDRLTLSGRAVKTSALQHGISQRSRRRRRFVNGHRGRL